MQFILRDNNGVMISKFDFKVFQLKDLETMTTQVTKKFKNGPQECRVFNDDYSLKIKDGTVYLWKDWYLVVE